MDSYKQTVSSLGFRVGRVRVEHWQMYPGRGQLISAPLSACSFSSSSSFFFFPFFCPFFFSLFPLPFLFLFAPRDCHKCHAIAAITKGARKAREKKGVRRRWLPLRPLGTRRSIHWDATMEIDTVGVGCARKKKKEKKEKGQPLRAHLRFPSVLQCPAVSGERRCQMCFPIRIHPNHLQEQCRGQGCAALLSSPRPPG